MEVIKMLKHQKSMQWEDGYVDYPGKGIITDKQVAEFTKKHMTVFSWLFRPKKVAQCSLISQNILMGVIEEPKEKWKF